MAITVRGAPNATTMANNWATGVAAAGAKWLNGVNNPRALPNANPQQDAANWLAGVTAAQPAYIAGISSPNYLTDLAAGATAKQSSYTGSGTTRKANAQAAFTNVATMIQGALASLPAKGPKGTNTARSTAFANAMHAQKGKGKA